jgi:peptidoglycan/xylan/chitin deacetylase (PgdA/CDA1 family)
MDMTRRGFLSLAAASGASILVPNRKSVASIITPSAINLSPAGVLTRGLLTFTVDDAGKTLYGNAFPVLEALKIRGTAYAIAGRVGAAGSANWTQLKTMQSVGWEIGDHTFSHSALTDLDEAAIRAEIAKAENLFLSNGINSFGSFAPSFGAVYDGYPDNEYDIRVMDAVFATGLITSSRRAWREDRVLNDPVTFDSKSICVASIRSNTTAAEIKALMAQAATEKKWLVLVIHVVSSTLGDEYTITPAFLKNIATYANTMRTAGTLDIVTVSKGVKTMEIARNLL